MSGFKDSTRTTKGHHNWGGGTVGLATGGTVNRLAAGGPVAGVKDAISGEHEGGGVADFKPYGKDHGLIHRSTPMTEELKEAGGTSPLRSGFKKGGKAAKHFHVHKHFHAKGGRTHSVSHSYSAAEKHAETYAEGGHVHDSTTVPPNGPDYKRGGKAKPVKKNAGGALYAPGGAVQRPFMGGQPPMGAQGALGGPGGMAPLQARPRGLPIRPQLPMRHPMPMPGPSPMTAARGGKIR